MKGIFAAKGVFAPRWVIPVLPILAVLGSYALPLTVAGVNLFAFRMLILVMAAFSTPLTSASGWWFNKLARWTVLLGVLWLTYGMLSLLWTPNLSGGMADVMSIGFGFALLLVLFNVRAHETQHLQLLRIGWVAAFVVTAAVAIWELVTGQHLYSTMLEESTYYFDGTVVQSTLGRPDIYGAFLVLAVPFLLWSLYESKGVAKLMYAGFLFGAGALTLFTASRLSFLAVAAELLLLVFIIERRWHVIALGLISVAVGYFWWSNVFLSSELRLAREFQSALSEGGDRSINTRAALTMNGLWMMYSTAGRGVGAAGFTDVLVSADVPFRLAIPKREGFLAHNLWAQIAAEYGILTVLGLIALFLFMARLALQATNRGPPGRPHEVRVLGIVTLVGLAGYLFYGVVVGSVIRQSVHWMFFASLVVIAAHLYQARAAYRAARLRGPQGQLAGARALGPAGAQGVSGVKPPPRCTEPLPEQHVRGSGARWKAAYVREIPAHPQRCVRLRPEEPFGAQPG